MGDLKENIEYREKIIESLKEELIGPLLYGKGVNIIDEQTTKENINGNLFMYRNNGKLEEIFCNGLPSKKYAAGLIYPYYSSESLHENEEDLEVFSPTNDENVNAANFTTNKETFNKQSTLGFTFAVPIDAKELIIRFNCGIYEDKTDFNKNLQIDLKPNQKWWFRKSLISESNINLNTSDMINSQSLNLYDIQGNIHQDNKIKLFSHIRNFNNRLKIVTITIANISDENENKERTILFQCDLKAHLKESFNFLPYPKPSDMSNDVSWEDRKFELLYSKENNYAFGHDCSVKWTTNDDGEVNLIETTFVPEYEIKTMTPNIAINGKEVEIRHADIIAAENYNELVDIINPLIVGYENWIKDKENEEVEVTYLDIKNKHINELNEALNRMKKGLELLKEERVYNSFKLCNLAMLMQMNNGNKLREIVDTERFSKNLDLNGFDKLNFHDMRTLSDSVLTELDNKNESFTSKKWRAFQIAFLIQSLSSIVNKKSIDREIVDLIWFPTGGGKTEAYLAVSCFSIFYRRLLDKNDVGMDTMMRYTLRLLTTDQFQRSARMICSIEYIRRKKIVDLGEEEISIGLWVGKSNTPNKDKDAKSKLVEIVKGKSNDTFIVNSCPWCGAEIKPLKSNNKTIYKGFRFTNELICYCPDKNCEFSDKLPIYFVDEQLYKKPPTFLIGTIDKFVQLTWEPKARSLFGLNNDGERVVSPPNLIIQDELHLISGPLGSLTGIYETLIDELTHNQDVDYKPKIIGATATIKSYQNQIKALFGREVSRVFPPPALDMNDNFFSKVMKDSNGKDFPGRKYVGIYTTTQGKLQTQVQTFSNLLVTVNNFKEEFKDSFWTILSFYNSIKDIGKANSLVEVDIPYTMKYYFETRNIDKDKRRYLNTESVKELTSRMENSQISGALQELKTKYTTVKNKSIDLVLASNIIEVGVDIDRLGLMTIVGQPKSTAQYIQVSGRIGRKVTENPGLVVVLYSQGDSNDKSHYEHFIEYHQKLYSDVEETSITPFSSFSIERGLPAVIIGYLRQAFSLKELGEAPNAEVIQNNKNKILKFIENKVIKKMKLVDTTEKETLIKVYKNLIYQLENLDYEAWVKSVNKNGFMVQLNAETIVQEDEMSIINSMRNVDSNSQLVVSPPTRKDSISEIENLVRGI